MNDTTHLVPPDVRAAISAFLNECQKEAQPIALLEALAAIRRIFPDLEISDNDLVDAITSEASAAGLDIDSTIPVTSEKLTRESLGQWDDEGGAIGKPRTEAQRRINDDTSSSRRRAKATKDRNELI